ncbi:MAG: outer membrane lipoprotein carrier protein LolA [Gammaproteobacteria bacterium]|nr:outer membrane lipoprotein carrier protein LolA [Gammaproteobacteria bacterium]MDD9871461.1 outer membrane lipoprotein carrier protein LolA [Gammaproteobacteria bacterium]
MHYPAPGRPNERTVKNLTLTLAALCAAALWTPAAADGAWDLPALMKELGGIRLIDAAFTEQKQAEFLSGGEFAVSGEMHFKAPHTLRRIVTKPYRESIIIDESTVIIKRMDSKNETDKVRFIEIDSHPSIRLFIDSMRATMAGDLATVLEIYEVELSGDRGEWSLRLVPQRKALKKFINAVDVTGSANRISTLLVHEDDGTRSLITLDYNFIR